MEYSGGCSDISYLKPHTILMFLEEYDKGDTKVGSHITFV